MAGRTRSRRSKGRKRQKNLLEQGRGGFRLGSGPKRKKHPKHVRRTRRPELSGRDPLHVWVHLADELPGLRKKREFEAVRTAFFQGCDRFGFRLVHFAVMSNPLHMIVEADQRESLSKGLGALLIRVARGLNRLWQRKGKVFRDRYAEEILDSPTKARNAIQYVLNNARRHGARLKGMLDRFSSGGWFRGWKEGDRVPRWQEDARPTAEARTWVLMAGLAKAAPISVFAVPGPRRN